MVGSVTKIWAILDILLGLYLVNAGFDIIEMPEFILNIESWFFLIAGILLFFAGLGILRRRKYKDKSQ